LGQVDRIIYAKGTKKAQHQGIDSPNPLFIAAPYDSTLTPSITTIEWSANQVHIGLTGLPGSSYIVQESTDLQQWTTLGTYAIPDAGSVEIVDPAPDSTRRFYRALVP
jgi:hypothetical protein